MLSGLSESELILLIFRRPPRYLKVLIECVFCSGFWITNESLDLLLVMYVLNIQSTVICCKFKNSIQFSYPKKHFIDLLSIIVRY